jgi:hypothetical protein
VGTSAFAPQLLQFLKNTAITGGLLLIAITPNQPALFRAVRGQAPRRKKGG